MKLRKIALSLLGVFGVAETVLIPVLTSDAFLHLVKKYPTFSLVLFATTLSLLLVSGVVVLWLMYLILKAPTSASALPTDDDFDDEHGMRDKILFLKQKIKGW